MSARALTALALAAVPFAFSAIQDPTPATASETTVLDHMEAFKTSLKTIAMGLGNPQEKDAVLAAAVVFQDHAQAAKRLAPANLREVHEDERGAHTLAFRKSMIALQRALLDLEEKLLDDDAEGVMAMIREDLLDLRNASHEAYQLPD